MQGETFFLGLKQPDGVSGLIPFKTDWGQYHLAFSSSQLAERYMGAMMFGPEVFIMPNSSMSPAVRYDFSHGFLLFTEEESIRAFALELPEFNHTAHVTFLPGMPISERPW
jgi:hypothetical protein